MSLPELPPIPNFDEWTDGAPLKPAALEWLNRLANGYDQIRTQVIASDEAVTALQTVEEIAEVAAVTSGILRQVASPAFLASPLVATAGSTVTLASATMACTQVDGRVVVDGNCARSFSAAGTDNDGTQIYLYVDGVNSGITAIEDWSAATGVILNTPVKFIYTPADVASHTYTIRASSTIDVTFGYANWIQLSEVGPNQTG